MTRRPFHLAFPVDDLAAAEDFYAGLLGCRIGRRSARWIDFDFFGNQITAHLRPEDCIASASNGVDGDAVPVRHFGAILAFPEWEALSERLRAAGMAFLIAPKIRFRSKAGEQGTFFIRDPAGNALEFKAFRDMEMIFAPGDEHDHA